MFFVSEEFLRKYEETGEAVQTLDQVVKPGEGLFEQDYKSKADKKKKKSK